MFTSILVGITLMTPDASAGKCDSLLKQSRSASGSNLIRTFERLATCDSTMAENNFHQIMTRATDAESLTNLSMAAINADIWSPVWTMPGKISSYEARDEITNAIGGQCASNDKVVTFLQGAYAGIKAIEFQQWDDAFVSCESAPLNDWMVQQIENPPEKLFDDKFDKLVDIIVEKQRSAAVPHLITGAIKAADNGPFNKMVDSISAAIIPNLGRPSAAETQAVQDALVQVAQGVSAEKAKLVAESLAANDAMEAAISLLPTIYSDRIQGNGGFLYGVAAVETGECKGVKTAVIHHAQVSESGSLWSIEGQVEDTIRASKTRLKKCTIDDGDWETRVTFEPLASGSDIGSWVDEWAEQLRGQDFEVSIKSEKPISLN
ncbi:MAG: hypothetical protein P8R54_14680 [Myxococcota bacterium]|nr:hypothetical protein [Myxococcota bacterium]